MLRRLGPMKDEDKGRLQKAAEGWQTGFQKQPQRQG
jgi:hypothetical protein